MKKDKMNSRFKHFYNISNKKVREFAELNRAIADDFKFSEDWECYKTVISFNDYEIHFLIGEGLSRGYRFLEGSNTESELCLLTRFKFNFSDIYFSPYDIHNSLELGDFRTLDFHKLLDDSMINNAFSAIFDFIAQTRVGIERLSSDFTLQNKLVENFRSDMSIVSKKITDEKLKDNFFKYFTKHEFNMYFYIEGADAMLGFISTGRQKPLENYFIKKSRKNKLITYEKRFYDYLVLNDFKMPQGIQNDFANKIRTDEKHGTVTRTVSIIIALVLTFVYDLATYKIAEGTLFKDYNIIYSYDSSSFIWIIGACGLAGLISVAVKKLFFRNSTAKCLTETNDKTVNAIFITLCIVAVAAYCPLQYFSNQNCIALGENDIIINQSLRERGTVSYGSDKIAFCLIEGGYDEDDNYTDDAEYKELLIVLDGDYYSFIFSDLYDQELLNTVSELETHNITIESYKNLAQYEEMHNIE